MQIYNKDVQFFDGDFSKIENIETKYIPRAGSEHLTCGTIHINNSNLKATIIGREKEVPYGKGKRYFIVFEDNLIRLCNVSTISSKTFRHPINFSKGNNDTNPYKTIYKRYEQILYRTSNPNDTSYGNYGGRGIKCNFTNFYDFYFHICKMENFDKLLDSETRGSYDIDRINNDGNYENGNIRIVSKGDNHRNRRNNRNYKVYNYSTKKIEFIGNQIDTDAWFIDMHGFVNSHVQEAWKNKLRVGPSKGLTYVILMDDEEFDFENYQFYARASVANKQKMLSEFGYVTSKF